jgi:hypothetical protein
LSDTTRTLIAEYSLTSGHGDCIDFSNEYYDSGDEFPLAYITADTVPPKVYVNRLTRTGATLIRTLKFSVDKVGYYAGHAVDSDGMRIIELGYKNNSYNTNDGTNYMICTVWDLKTLTDNGDGTYTPSLIKSFKLPFMTTTQGQCFFRGRLYTASSDYGVTNTTNIYVIDIGNESIISVIGDFPTEIKDREAEGVFFILDGDKYAMYIDAQNGSRLARLSFD